MRKHLVLMGAAAIALAGGLALQRLDPAAASGNVTLAAPSGQGLASDSSTLLVDIRRPEEWRETGVIEGALLLTYTDPASFLEAVRPHLTPGQSLSLICRSGNRTSRAARQIAGSADAQVIDIKGGMLRILAEGYTPVAPTRAMGCQTC